MANYWQTSHALLSEQLLALKTAPGEIALSFPSTFFNVDFSTCVALRERK
jgi:hypothetical protein